MKIDRKHDLDVLCQVCVFRADRKNKMAALASGWYIFDFSEAAEQNSKKLLEARSQRPLPSLCFSGRWEKQDGCLASGWYIFDFSKTAEEDSRNLDRKPDLKRHLPRPIGKTRWLLWLRHFRLLWNCWNLTGSKILMSSAKFVFFGPIKKNKMAARPLIGRDIFVFSSSSPPPKISKIRQYLEVILSETNDD